MINARTINDALQMVFNTGEISRADLLRTCQAAVILVFNNGSAWEAKFDPSARAKYNPWTVKNKITGQIYAMKNGRPYRYDSRSSAEGVAERINRKGS